MRHQKSVFDTPELRAYAKSHNIKLPPDITEKISDDMMKVWCSIEKVQVNSDYNEGIVRKIKNHVRRRTGWKL